MKNKKIIRIAILVAITGWLFIIIVGHILSMRPRANRTDIAPLAELSYDEVYGFSETLSSLSNIQIRESVLEITRVDIDISEGDSFEISGYLPGATNRFWRTIDVFETSELAYEYMNIFTSNPGWRSNIGYEIIVNENDTSAILFRNTHGTDHFDDIDYYRVMSVIRIGNAVVYLVNSQPASVWNFGAMAAMEEKHSEIIRIISDIATGEFIISEE